MQSVLSIPSVKYSQRRHHLNPGVKSCLGTVDPPQRDNVAGKVYKADMKVFAEVTLYKPDHRYRLNDSS